MNTTKIALITLAVLGFLGCDDGLPQPPPVVGTVCTGIPAAQCDGAKIQVCDTISAAWSAPMDCPFGMTCVDGACAAK